MKVIVVLSCAEFKRQMLSRWWNDDTIDDQKTKAIISIGNTKPSEDDNVFSNGCNVHWFKKEHDNVLNIDFDDCSIEHNSSECTAITNEQANIILDFIEKNKDKTIFAIHCSAGISRSGAVAFFVKDYFKYLEEKVTLVNEDKLLPNQYVLRLLHAALMNKL